MIEQSWKEKEMCYGIGQGQTLPHASEPFQAVVCTFSDVDPIPEHSTQVP